MLDFNLEELIVLEQALNTHYAHCNICMSERKEKQDFMQEISRLKSRISTEIDERTR